MSRVRIIAIAGLTLALVAARQRGPLLVGVLEQPQCKEGAPTGIRPLFGRSDSGWTALDRPWPVQSTGGTRRTWTVAFDGRSLGALVSVDPGFSSPYAWTYSRDHLETVLSGRRVPRVGNSARAFSGWCDPPSVRPLVVVSDTNFRDPQRWRRFAPDDSYRHTLFRRFQVVVNRVIKCSSPEDTGTVWHYGPSDLTFSKSYVDTLGNRLIALGLNPQSNHCDGPPGPQWSPHWFVIGADTSYLGAEMELVDAGDYDADGQSEVLFWHSGYNEDGYSLFFQQFRKRTDFFWTYH